MSGLDRITSWNHRFVAVEIDGETQIGLYEVYYNDAGEPISRTSDLATFVGDTRMEAFDALSMGARAIGTEILDDSVFGAKTP